MEDFDLAVGLRLTPEQEEAERRYQVGQSTKLAINRSNDRKVEVLSEPCESCSA